MKRFIAVLSCLLILVSVFTCLNLSCYANQTAFGNTSANVVKSDEIKAVTGKSVSIPININNETALLGFKLVFSYDPAVMTPVSVEYGNACENGLENNIDGDSIPGKFCVYWAGNQGKIFNGVVLYLNFLISDNAFGKASIEIDYSKEDTFDDNFNSVALTCNTILLSITNSQINSYCKGELFGGTYEQLSKECAITAGEMLYVKTDIEHSDGFEEILKQVSKENRQVKFSFDKSAFEFSGFYYQTDSERVVCEDTFESTADGVALDYSILETYSGLVFRIKDTAQSGNYPIEMSFSKEIENKLDYYQCKPLKVLITSLMGETVSIGVKEGIVGKKGSNIDVPILIGNNHGLMGYRLKIEYNAAQLKPVSVNNASAFPGNFNDSIGQKDGEFFVVWNSTQSNFSNGQLMSVRFEVITASACESAIKISYIQADTFDEAYKDVVFDCREGSVYLNCDHSKSSTQVISPTCTDNEFTVYTCTICGYSYKTEKSGSALGHDWTNRTVVESATCVKTGFEKVSCSRCKIEKTILIPKTEHKWDSGKITKEATCVEEGIRTYTCSLCHENRAESLAKKPHTTTKTTEKATLNSDGKIETKCSVCGEVIDSTAILRPTTIKLSASAFTYDGKVKTPGVVVKDAAGKTVSNSNYTVTYSSGRKNVGKYAVKITFKGDYSGTKILYFTIKPKPTNIKLSATSYTYDGKVKKPGVTVKDANGKTISKSLYTVSYAKGRKSVGKYAVKVSFKGNCYEAKTLYFTIKPKPTSISAVKSASKGFSLKWKKQAVQTSGYEIQYAVDSKFTKEAKTVTVPKNTTTSKKIAKIKGKKKYYIRVRTYKLVKINGKSTRIYSGWSKVKTVKTK